MIRRSGNGAEGGEEFAAHTEFVAREIGRCLRAGGKLGGIHQNLDRAMSCIQPDHVAVLDAADRAVVDRLGRDMDGGRHLAGGAGHAAVGEQRYALAAILQDAEHGGQLVQFRHAVRLRPLEAHDGDEIAREFAGLEGGVEFELVVEDLGRCLDDMAFRLDSRNLDDGLADIAGQHLEAAGRLEGRLDTGEHFRIVADLRGLLAHDRAVLAEPGIDRIGLEAAAIDRAHVVMQHAGLEQFLNEEAHAAGGVEMVHVGKTVRIDAGKQRYDVGQFGNILPGQNDAGGARHGDKVQRVVG